MPHVDRHVSNPPLIGQRPGQSFGFAKIRNDPRELAEGEERCAKVEAEVDRLLQRLPGLGQVLEGRERLLEAGDRLAVGRSSEGLGAGLTEVPHGLLPDLAPERVVRECLEMLDQAVGMESLDRIDDLGVQRPTPIVEQTPISDVVDQRVLEGVLEIREQARLVEELTGHEMGEPRAERFFR